MGGGREVALAALMAAHLAESVRGEFAVGQPERATRASQAKIWLASLALPAAARASLMRCVDATSGTPVQVATALRSGTPQERAHEFADVLAWLATLANIAQVDLDQAMAAKYGGGCPGCGASPCICAPAEKP